MNRHYEANSSTMRPSKTRYFIIGDHVVANVRGNRWKTLNEDEYFRVRMVDVEGSSHRINPLPERIIERKREERDRLRRDRLNWF